MYYYLPWILLMGASLAGSIGLVIWGIRSGQFSEQERAGYLPLRDMPNRVSPDHPGRITKEVYVLRGLVGAVAFILAMVLAAVLI